MYQYIAYTNRILLIHYIAYLRHTPGLQQNGRTTKPYVTYLRYFSLGPEKSLDYGNLPNS
jgi:hypothetical protein